MGILKDRIASSLRIKESLNECNNSWQFQDNLMVSNQWKLDLISSYMIIAVTPTLGGAEQIR